MSSRTAHSLLSQPWMLLLAATAISAQDTTTPFTVDPFADPKNDPFNPLKYIASNALTATAMALVLAIALPHTWFTWRVGGRFMLAMVIAEYTYALGIASRFGLHLHPDSNGIYIVQYLFVTLSPCGFIAAEYVLLGRMAKWLGGDRHLLIRPQRITLAFVLSDVTTFLIQAAGGSVSASAHKDPQMARTGSRIFLVGLILQLISFACFMAVYFRFTWRMWKLEPEICKRDAHLPWYNDWRALCAAMWISCIGVLVRCVFRTVELSEGFQGHLTTTESYFYALDVLPLLIALVIYIPFWPGRFIPNDLVMKDVVTESEPVARNSMNEGTLNEVQRDVEKI